MSRERPALSRERIVDESLALLDVGGLDEFSMRKLAARLGVEAMSIYYHFPNRRAILSAVADRIVGEIVVPATGLPWRMRLERFAEEMYRVLMAHPAMVTILATEVADPADPRALTVVDQTLATLEEAGFSPAEQVIAFHAMTAMIFGFVLAHSRGIAGSSGRVAGDVPSTVEVIRAGGDEIPHLVALLPAFLEMPPGEDFRLMLRLFLDGLEREREARSTLSEMR